MDDNTFDKIKAMLNNGNIPPDLQDIVSKIASSNTNTSNEENTSHSSDESTSSIDFETIMKFKSIMDKMNSKDDPRSKLLTSLKPYLKESRKNKVDQYIQFFNMSKVMGMFSNFNGDGK